MCQLLTLTRSQALKYKKQLKKVFEDYNQKHFNGALPQTPIQISAKISPLGIFDGDKVEIVINEGAFLVCKDDPLIVARGILLHEMIHLHLKPNPTYHGMLFQNLCNRISNQNNWPEVSEAYSADGGLQCQHWPHIVLNKDLKLFDAYIKTCEFVNNRNRLNAKLNLTPSDSVSVVVAKLRDCIEQRSFGGSKKQLELLVALLKADGIRVDLDIGHEILKLI